jgi:pyruvate/2-oxoglutarate dehydrogenase complex dihydrolipoamide acyltransferase (E2) component
MIINIQIDTREELSTEDKALLRAIGYMDDEETPTATPVKAAAPKTEKAPRAAKKAAAPSKPSEPVSEAEESSPEADTDLRDAALARASELLSSGKRDEVMAALQGVGVGRVRDIAEGDLQSFIDSLPADDA